MYRRQVVVVEDDAFMRSLVASSLEAKNFQVTVAANVAEAKRLCNAIDPDAVVIDIQLGDGPNGFEFADYLGMRSPHIAIVFLTNLPDPRFAGRDRRSMPANAAYVCKTRLSGVDELVGALESVLREQVSVRYRHDLQSGRPLAALSKKQLSVLSQVAKGLTNAQIASARGSSVRAVEGMIGRVFEALALKASPDSNARVEATKMFLEAIGPRADF
jgi:DNA-binding NarL/FixJ family response regulator